jgi:hypothetical protein
MTAGCCGLFFNAGTHPLANKEWNFFNGIFSLRRPLHLNFLYEFADTRSSQSNNKSKDNNQIKDLQAGQH